MDHVCRRGESVVRVPPLARYLDEPLTAQQAKVTRNSGLWQGEHLDDVADTELSSGQDVQDPESRGVSERLEQRVQVADGGRRRGGGPVRCQQEGTGSSHIRYTE